PTGAMTVVLLPLVSQYGVAALAPVGILAGVFLLVFAFARIGRFIRYIPYPVIAGFTTGIAVIIFLQQLPGFLGTPKPEGEQVAVVSWQTLRTFADAPGVATPLLGLLTVGIMVGWARTERLRAFP